MRNSITMTNLVQFSRDQQAELLNEGYFKTYASCKECGKIERKVFKWITLPNTGKSFYLN